MTAEERYETTMTKRRGYFEQQARIMVKALPHMIQKPMSDSIMRLLWRAYIDGGHDMHVAMKHIIDDGMQEAGLLE